WCAKTLQSAGETLPPTSDSRIGKECPNRSMERASAARSRPAPTAIAPRRAFRAPSSCPKTFGGWCRQLARRAAGESLSRLRPRQIARESAAAPRLLADRERSAVLLGLAFPLREAYPERGRFEQG